MSVLGSRLREPEFLGTCTRLCGFGCSAGSTSELSARQVHTAGRALQRPAPRGTEVDARITAGTGQTRMLASDLPARLFLESRYCERKEQTLVVDESIQKDPTALPVSKATSSLVKFGRYGDQV